DETTQDGAITLERIECNAACDYAPVVMANWEFFDNQTPESAIELVDTLRAGDQVRPTRGSDRVCTFTEVSRVLAGFPDGRASEGLGAGPASLAGLRVAHEQGWTAPADPHDRSGQDEATRAQTSPEADTEPSVTPSSGGSAQGAPATAQEGSSADTPANAPDEKPGDGKVGE
ncbi:MAG: NAD(P)H-dependent oxidoreductase subunit E, partial [Micrococcales bacterium]|nr:NAD(P)H-dependent oxidoreductase subunit E [Micrococcales bacterium]